MSPEKLQPLSSVPGGFGEASLTLEEKSGSERGLGGTVVFAS